MPRDHRVARWLYALPLRLRSLFRGREVEAEMHEEVAYYLDRLTEENIAAGMAPRDARQAALRRFGGVAQRQEEIRDTRRVRLIEDLVQDVRYALRTLARARGYTAASVLTLSLGIGACVAVFTIVNGVLLRPLPFPQADRLFLISHSLRGPFLPQPSLTDHDYLAFRASDRAFEHAAAFVPYAANVMTPLEPLVATICGVTSEFFTTLKVPAAIGRTFMPGDEQQADQLVVLGNELWQANFGADAGIVGRTVAIDGRPRTVLGVMPAGFRFPEGAQAWTLYTVRLDPHRMTMTPVVGRLRPGITRLQAQAQFEAIAAHLTGIPGEAPAALTSGILPLKELWVEDIRRPLQVFSAAVIIVLLIGCANFANLLLARASARQREIAIRRALGASRGRLVRQFLTESTLVSVMGGACGLTMASLLVPALLAIAPAGRIPFSDGIDIDARVAGFALALSILTGVLFGIAPAWRMTSRRRMHPLTPGVQALARDQQRPRGVFVVAEVAMALVLLMAAGLLIQSLLRLRAVDPGFHPTNVVALTVDLPASVYPTAAKMSAFHKDLLDRLGQLPGAQRVGMVNWRPFGSLFISGDVEAKGVRMPPGFRPDKPAVSPGYFETMGIRLLKGRDFTAADGAGAPGVAIVSERVARILDPSGSVVGRPIAIDSPPGPDDWLTIVGVVDDVRQLGPTAAAHAAIYRPYMQVTQPFFLGHMTFVVRTTSDPLAIVPEMRAALRAVDRTQPARSIVSMESEVAAATAEQRFNARLLVTFASVALILALVGIYGVLGYSVAQRRREIGIRMALGAAPRAVLSSVIGSGLGLTAVGVAIGLAGAFAASRALTSMLYGVAPHDPVTYVVTVLLMTCAALAASYFPARRAMRVDPVVVLKEE
jgi:putative ABC transport system permease protein